MINWYLMISCDVWNGFKWLQPSTWRQGSFQYFCLQTADGRSLSLTGDHLLRLRRDDVWHWRRAKDACLAENHRVKGPPVMAIVHRWKWWSDFRTNPPQLSKGELWDAMTPFRDQKTLWLLQTLQSRCFLWRVSPIQSSWCHRCIYDRSWWVSLFCSRASRVWQYRVGWKQVWST